MPDISIESVKRDLEAAREEIRRLQTENRVLRNLVEAAGQKHLLAKL
jgi:hypothetical protein